MVGFLAKSALIAAVAILFFAFSNCGQPFRGSDDSNSAVGGVTLPSPPPPGPNFAAIAGIYSSGTTHHVVLPNGEYWTWGGYGILQMKFGAITLASAGNFAGQITAGNSGASAISGTYVVGTSFSSGAYFAGSLTPAALSTLVGQWWGNLQDGDTPYLTFDASGTISGTSANQHCVFTGALQPHPSGLNVYRVDITRANCLGSGTSEAFVGIARVMGKVIHIVALNGAKSRTLAWEGYRL